jgi:microcystin-dependent protein
MTQPFLGQVQPFAFGFAPRYWAQCNGQLLSIAQNNALFALLGTTFGGNGVNTFQLPNLQSCVPIHYGTYVGTTYDPGEVGGNETVTLSLSNLPMHNHNFLGTQTAATSINPTSGSLLAKTAIPSGTALNFYASDATTQVLNPASIAPVGGNTAHANIQPYLAINFCIALYGIFPSRG